MKKSLLLKLFALVAAMMCALGASAVEAYACYTPSNTTLTFYYDTQRASRPGTTYDLNTGTNDPGWVTDGITRPEVTKVVFDSSFANARPTTTFNWFYFMLNLESITGMSYLNTSEVAHMDYMFYSCHHLTSLDLSSFNTSKVTSMRSIFFGCTGLTSVDLSSFNTSNVTYMEMMFYYCSNLTTVYVGEGWSTEAVTNSTQMFGYCSSLVGGMGTTYDANHVDAAYAHIDGGPSNPGYFTDPNAVPEAYACYTPSNTTLTFYYDTQRSTRPGTTYDLNTGSNKPGWYTDETYSSVTQVVFDASFAGARPASGYYWFYNMRSLHTITGMKEYLNTEEMTSMYGMFYYCNALTSLDLSGFNTGKVTSMQSMFMYCRGLTTLDLSSFNTEKVTNMQYMFGFSNGLTSLDLSSFNTPNASIMYGLFYQCNNLATIYASSDWNTGSLTSYGSAYLFQGCTRLVGGLGTVYDANHTNATYAHIDGGPSDPGYFTDPNAVAEAYACYTPSDSTLTFYYDSGRSSREGTTYDLNTGDDNPLWIADGINASVTKVVFNPLFADARPTSTNRWFYNMGSLDTITGIEYLNTEAVTNMFSMFDSSSGLTSLDLSHFNTAMVTNMEFMFYRCSGLTSLDLSSFNTSNVTAMDCIFYRCSGLTSLDLSGFNTSNVTSIRGMFGHCSGLTSLDLSSFNTSNVTNMCDMFYSCSGLTSLDLSSFNTSNVTNMIDLFTNCSSLTSLDLSSFNTTSATHMTTMFKGCSSLTSLDLSGFNTANVTNMGTMFNGCSGLTTIYTGDGWSTAAVTSSDNMFTGCTSLVGGQGTTYDANHTDATYAHIDGGPSDPGYFTAKNAGMRGDVNNDQKVDIADATALINYLLYGDATNLNLENANCNLLEGVDIADATTLINYLLYGTW